MAIQELDVQEVDTVSGAGFLAPLADLLGIGPNGLLGGGGGTLGGGGFVRGVFSGIPILGALIIFGESAL
jgi:hypothetical protein